MSACADPSADLGVIRSVLGTVDCHVRTYSEAGYHALTGPGSFFPTALTAMLTVYVALLGIRLMFGIGPTRLLDAPVLALKIGVVLALTLNWATFQTLVFDLTLKAPLQVARVVASPVTSGRSQLASSPLDGLQIAYDQLALDASALGRAAGPDPQVLQGGPAAAAESLWKAQKALFMSTAGLMAIATIAVGVLAAVGPVFIALFLFQETRGLFAGWLRAILSVALMPMLCWITTAVMLVVLEPWLADLAKARDSTTPDLQAASIVSAVVFIFAIAQGALAFGAAVIASGLQIQVSRARPSGARSSAQAPAADHTLSRVERLAMQLQHSAALRSFSFAGAAAAPRLATASVGRASLRVESQGVIAGSSGPGRLGDGYRRGAFLDRIGTGRRTT